MRDLIELLNDVKPGVGFNEDTLGIIDERVLDSMDIITLVSRLNDEFDIEISVSDLTPENFNSVKAIYDMIIRLQEE